MKKKIILVLCLILAFFSACSLPPAEVQQGSAGDAIFVKITENGISLDASEVVISNMHPGARAEMTYRIHNATAKAIIPEIFWVKADIASYSKANGAIQANYAEPWLEIPKMVDVPPGQIHDFTVALVMPGNAKEKDKKIGFQVGVADATDGNIQTSAGTWWIVNMR